MVLFGEIVCIRTKVVVIGYVVISKEKWLYSGKKGCIRAKGHVFGQCGCVWAKVVVFGQSSYIRAKWLYSGKSGCIRAK